MVSTLPMPVLFLSECIMFVSVDGSRGCWLGRGGTVCLQGSRGVWLLPWGCSSVSVATTVSHSSYSVCLECSLH